MCCGVASLGNATSVQLYLLKVSIDNQDSLVFIHLHPNRSPLLPLLPVSPLKVLPPIAPSLSPHTLSNMSQTELLSDVDIGSLGPS